MPPAPAAREKVLDAFERLLLSGGERAATLEAVAAEAGVSKGGLLYHFGSKDALADGLLGRLADLVGADAARMREAPEGAAEHYLRVSVFEDSPLDRAIVATARLAQGAHAPARQALRGMHEVWLAAVADDVGDSTVARAVMLMGDGLYYNAALSGSWGDPSRPPSADVDQVLEVLRRLTGRGRSGSAP